VTRLYVCTYIYSLSIYRFLSTCLSSIFYVSRLSLCLSNLCSVCLSTYLSACPCLCLSVCLPVSLSVYLSGLYSVYMLTSLCPIYPFAHLPAYSVCMPIFRYVYNLAYLFYTSESHHLHCEGLSLKAIQLLWNPKGSLIYS
jgi:hypothetical protein